MSFGSIREPKPYTGPQAPDDQLVSKTMTFKDYAVLNRRTQERGMSVGVGSGIGFTYGVHKIRPQTTRNILFLTFFTSTTFMTYLTSTYLLTSHLRKLRASLPANQPPSPFAPDPISALTTSDSGLHNWKESDKA